MFLVRDDEVIELRGMAASVKTDGPPCAVAWQAHLRERTSRRSAPRL
jgi:hypothetical protein